jgi:putative OPT family oligopeptide transporter
MAAPVLPQGGDSFKPFVPATEERRELTARAAIIGSILGIVFGASSVFLALKVGLTVSASIPIAVLSIPIFRALGRGSILENNIVQTVGSAGESIAAGIAFTIPALLVMGYDLELSRTMLIALTGGWLGVMLMIPLRRALIVKEHGKLTYPEGTACAEVLEAGEKRGVQALLVTTGLLVGIVFKFLYKCLGFWKETPTAILRWYKNAEAQLEVAPELLGVGYIIGPRSAGSMVGGGVLSYLVLMPLIRFFGEKLSGPLAPGTTPIAEMSASQLRSNYILYIGVGCVAAAGIISLLRTMPTIVSTFAAAVRSVRGSGVAGGAGAAVPRTERDLPITVTMGGAVAIAILVAILPQLHVNAMASVLIIIFGFFFSTVSSRICGQIGSSSNPISGMTIATLLLTCMFFVLMGWRGAAYRPVVLTVAAIVCVAIANAGATSQDLKTGFLVGSTPRRQQIGLLIGVTTSALAVGWTLYLLNGLQTNKVDERIAHPGLYPRMPVAADAPTVAGPDGQRYRQVHTEGDRQHGIPPGKLLVDADGTVAFSVNPAVVMGGRDVPKVDAHGRPVQAVDERGQPQFDHGRPVWVKAEKFDAPKANLMALLIDGSFQSTLPWALVLFGVFITLVLELAGVEALPFAVGLYLPLSSSAPIWVGGMVRWIADRMRRGAGEGDAGPGVLLSSGLIAGGSLTGLGVLGVAAATGGDQISIPSLTGSSVLQWIANQDVMALFFFLCLAAYLLRVAVKDRVAR